MKLYEIDYYLLEDLIECDHTTHEQFNNCSEFIFEGSLANCLLKIEELCKKNNWHYEKNNFEELDVRMWNKHLQVNTYFNDYPATVSRVFIITTKDKLEVIDENNCLYNGIEYKP